MSTSKNTASMDSTSMDSTSMDKVSEPSREQAPMHTVFGAGQVGKRLADELLSRGMRVRLVRRGEAGDAAPGLTWLSGDLNDQSFSRGAAEGAEVLYNCVNPSQYHLWEKLLPPLYASIADAAAHSGARLVTLDNVYMYGDMAGAPMREESVMSATTKKGSLRARLSEELRQRADAGEFHLSTGRAADFFGPGASYGAIFSERSHARLLAGKPVEVMGDADAIHSYSFIPDVARGLATLGMEPTAEGGIFHLPVSWQGSTRELVVAIGQALGHREVKIRSVPSWFLRAAGVFVPLLSAVAEMTYQWEDKFHVVDEKFVATYGIEATPAVEAIAQTAAWISSELSGARAA